MSKKTKLMVICLFFILCLFSFSFAQQESMTITTYYPSPYGSYKELRAQRIAIGSTYYDSGSYPWNEGGVCLANQICNAALVVEGNVGIGTRSPGSGKSDAAFEQTNFLQVTNNTGLAVGQNTGTTAGDALITLAGVAYLSADNSLWYPTFGTNLAVKGSDTFYTPMTTTGYGYRGIRMGYNDNIDFVGGTGNTTAGSAVSPTVFMRIQTSTGNVGIGTTGPGAKLSFANLNDGRDTADGITWYNPSPQAYGIFRSAGPWSSPNYQQLTLNWSTGIVIDGGSAYGRSGTVLQPNGGNVGIGTTGPSTKLHIVTDGSTRAFRISGTASNQYTEMQLASDGTEFRMGVGGSAVGDGSANKFYIWNGAHRVVVDSSGNVGIGTTSPTSQLHIYRSTTGDYTNNALKVETAYGYATFGSLNGSWFHMSTSLPQFYFNNPCQANGGFSTYSSRDKKQDIRHLSTQEEDKVLESLLKMQMANFRYKDERFNKKVHLGVIAEESPEQILTVDKKAVELTDYISYAITAIKAQQRQIEELKAEIANLKKKASSTS